MTAIGGPVGRLLPSLRWTIIALATLYWSLTGGAQPIQGYDWARVVASTTSEKVSSVAIGPVNGQRYAAGTWTATSADGQPGLLTLLGQLLSLALSGFTLLGDDGMILNYPAAGGNSQWGVIIGGPSDDGLHAICTDAAGNIYVAGHFSTGARILPNGGNSILLGTSQGGTDMVVASFTADGAYRWHRVGGGPEADQATGIAESGGRVYVTGNSNGRHSIFGLAAQTSTGAVTQSNGVLFCLSATDGSSEWRLDASGGASRFNDVDANGGNVHVIGLFSGTTFTAVHPNGAQTTIPGGSNNRDGVVLSVHANGLPNWGRLVRTSTGVENEANGITSDGSGVYICGTTHNGSTFSGLVYSSVGSPHTHAYVARLERTTGTLNWVLPFHSTADDHGVSLRDITVDANNLIWTTGSFYQNIRSGSTQLASSTHAHWQLATLQVSWNGSLIKGYYSSADGDAIGNGVDTDGTGKVFIGGEWKERIWLQADYAGHSSNNLFVAGLTDPAFPLWQGNTTSDWVSFGPICSSHAPIPLDSRLQPFHSGTGTTVVGHSNISTSGSGNGPDGALGTPDEGHALFMNNSSYIRMDMGDTLSAGSKIMVRWRRTSGTTPAHVIVSSSMTPNGTYGILGTYSTNTDDLVHTLVPITAPARYIRLARVPTSTDFAVSGVYYGHGTLPGGTWSGPGVTNSIFHPAGLSGPVPITYTVGGQTTMKHVQVEALATPGAITGGGVVCPGTDVPLTLSGSSSTLTNWQVYPASGSAWVSVVPSTPHQYTLPFVNEPHRVRVRIAGTMCPITQTAEIEVRPEDTIPPVLTCPTNVSIGMSPGQCSATYNYPSPSLTDACLPTAPASIPGYTFIGTFNGHTYFRSHTSGPWTTAQAAADQVPGAYLLALGSLQEHQWLESLIHSTIGSYAPFWMGFTDDGTEANWRWTNGEPVTYTSWYPSQPDNSGNYGLLNLHNTIHWDDAPASTVLPWVIEFNSLPAIQPTRVSGPASGGLFQPGANTITFQGTDPAGNTGSCSFTVTVLDLEPATVNCPTDMVLTAPAGACTAEFNPVATATDNCHSTDLLVYDWSHGPGVGLPIGVTQVELRVFDGSLWSNTCQFEVVVKSSTPPIVSNCPSDMTVLAANGTCGAVVNYGVPGVSDPCALVDTLEMTLNDPAYAPGQTFPVGVHDVIWTATGISGQHGTCAFKVTVVDNTPPAFANCPTDIHVQAGNTCQASASWTVPTATDNCGSATVLRTAGPAPGSNFPLGATWVTYTATDLAGISSTCSFRVIVSDQTPPLIQNCPADITVFADGGCGAVPIWNAPTATDGCSGVSITRTNGPASGLYLPKGDHPVTYTATDAAGNTSTCTFLVRVIDNSPPAINNCPGNITVASNGACSRVVTWPVVTTWDNCSGATIVRMPGPGPGDEFMLGVTTVTYVATDAAGLTTTCFFTVTVTDDTPPVVQGCPGPITVPAGAGCEAIVTWTPPTAMDNCGPIAMTRTAGPAPGSAFPIGTTTVTYSASDPHGNTASCSFTVQVNAPTPADAGPNITTCANNGPVHLIGTPAGGSWSYLVAPTGPGGLDGDSYDPSFGNTTLVYTVDQGGCISQDQVAIIVDTPPVITLPGLSSFCRWAPATPLTATPAGGTWSPTTGLFGHVFDPSTVGTVSTTYSYTDPGTGCNASATLQLTVHPVPEISIVPVTSLCADHPMVPMSASPEGGSWTGPGMVGYSVDPAALPPGDHLYTYSYSNEFGCTGSAGTVLTILPLPSVSVNDIGPLCANAPAVQLSGTPSGGQWSGNGTDMDQFDPAIAGPGQHVLQYTRSSQEGCVRTASIEVTVHAVPQVVTGTYGPVCSNAPGVTLDAIPSGGVWSGTGVTGHTFDPINGTSTITYTATNAQGCSASGSTTVQVHVAPVVNTGTYGPMCSNGPMVQLGGTPVGGTWSGPGVSGGQFNPATGNALLTYTVGNAQGCSSSATTAMQVYAVQTPQTGSYGPVCANTSAITLGGSPAGGTWSGTGVTLGQFAPSSGTQTLTYTRTDLMGCTASASTTINVFPVPSVSVSTPDAICASGAPFNLIASPTGGTWSGPGVSSGAFAPSVAGTGTHTLTYTYHTSDGCSSQGTTSATVYAVPVIAPGSYPAVCVDAADIVLQATPAGGTWSFSPTGNGTGLGLNGNTYDPTYGTVDLIYSYTDQNHCGASAPVSIQVDPLPVVSVGNDRVICGTTGHVVLSPQPSGGIWTGGTVSGNSYGLAQGSADLTYTYIDPNGCQASDQLSITVHPLPEIQLTPTVDLCADADPFPLQASPGNGIWTGTGISNGQFDPAAGGQTLIYQVTDANNCSNSATQTITVHALPIVNLGADIAACADAGDIDLAPQPTGGTWSSSSVINDHYAPANGDITLIYTVTDPYGCVGHDTVEILVNAVPVISVNVPTELCADNDPVQLVATPAGGSWNGPGVTGDQFDPDGLSGTQGLTYAVTDAHGCSASMTVPVQVTTTIVVTAGTYDPRCSSSAPITLVGTPAGGQWSGPGMVGPVFHPSDLAGPQVLTYTFGSGACQGTSTTTILVDEQPVVSAGPDQEACVDGHLLAAYTSVGTGTWSTSSGSSVSAPNAPQTAAHMPSSGSYTFVWNVVNGTCSASDAVTLSYFDPSDPLWADAGPDLDFDIYLSTPLQGDATPSADIRWSVVQGSGLFTDASDPRTDVTDLQVGRNVLVLSASFGQCRTVADSVRIMVNEVFIPQGFSPNSDGVNDLFEITGALVFPGSRLEVFDRWGNPVYLASPYRNEWDGRARNGNVLPDGTYYYTLSLTPERQHHGFVVIKR